MIKILAIIIALVAFNSKMLATVNTNAQAACEKTNSACNNWPEGFSACLGCALQYQCELACGCPNCSDPDGCETLSALGYENCKQRNNCN